MACIGHERAVTSGRSNNRILAAKLYTTDRSIGAALVSTLLTLCNFAQLNLGNVLNRFLPVAGVRTGRLILLSYAMGTAATVVVSSGFVLTAKVFAPSLGFLSDDFSAAVWFVAASIVWTLFVLQDGVLAGLRQSVWIPLENGIYAVFKIGLRLSSLGLSRIRILRHGSSCNHRSLASICYLPPTDSSNQV
jgi:hypothetical protein